MQLNPEGILNNSMSSEKAALDKMSTRKTRNKNSDIDEIVVYDDVHTRRRNRGPNKKTASLQDVKVEDPVEKPDDVLAEFDLDGVTDEEREQIKMAVLASKEESFLKVEPDAKTGPDDVIRLVDEEEEVVNESILLENEDAGTQMSDEDILSETKTNHAGDQDDRYFLPTQKDKTRAEQEEYTMSTQVDESGNTKIEERPANQEEDQAEKSNDEEEMMLDFSRSTLNNDEEDFETQKPDSPIEETQDYKTTTGCSYVNDERQKPIEKEDEKDRQNDEEQEMCPSDSELSKSKGLSSGLTPLKMDQNQISSQDSIEVNQGSSERSASVESQKSEGFSPTLQDGDSQEALSSNDSLQRHFRAVKFKPSRGPLYYCPVGMDVQKYAKVISQLFDIYSRKLKNAQHLCGDRLTWPEPVKPGQHHEKSIDAKRRGHDVQFFDLSEYDDNDDFKTDSKTAEKLKIACKDSDMDDDLPDLIVEHASDHQNVQKKSRFTAEEATQIICGKEELGSDHITEFSKRSGLSGGKRDGDNRGKTNSRKVGIVSSLKNQPVLVADTQMNDSDEDFLENPRRPKMDVIVEETQFCNEEEWLSVNKNTQKFEQLGQKNKLRGYTIPHKNVGTKPDMQLDKHHTTDSESSSTKKPLGKRRRDAAQVLVGETQTSDGEGSNLGTDVRKRVKHECFKIDSSSEDESIAETQEDKNEDREDVKQIEPQGFFAKIKSKVSNLISPIYTTKGETADSENQSITDIKTTRPLYSENFNKFDKTPVNKSRVRMKHDSECEPADVLFPASSNATLRKKTVNTCKSFSRNTSKDSIVSNNSEGVSVASSQVSGTLLNDNGDLFSTQFCEMRNESKPSKKRKAVSQLQDNETHSNRKASENESDVSEDEIVIIDVERKGAILQNEIRSRKYPMNKKQRVNQTIDSCFSKIDKDTSEVSKLNQQLVEVEELDLDDEGKYLSEDEDPFPKTYARRPLRETRSRNFKKVVNSERYDKSKKISTTTLNSQNKDIEVHCNQNSQSVQEVRPNNKTYTNKVSGWLDDQTDMRPVDVQNFSGRKNVNEDNEIGADDHLDLTDSNQVPEVVSEDSDEIQIRNDSPIGDNPNAVVSRDDEQIDMIECPLCGKEFSVQVIEEHAGTCEGPQPEEEAHTTQEDDGNRNGELETCWICEKEIPKVGSEKHVQECWNRAEQREQQQQNVKEEPVQTRRGKLRNAAIETLKPVSPRRPLHRNKENTDRH